MRQGNQLNERIDETSLADVQAPSEGDRATAYRSGTGRRLQIFAGLAAIALTVAFFVVHGAKARHENELSATTVERAATPPSVTVIPARAAQSTYALSLPGETAAWYESTIFARVNGYVAKWLVDIGDRVKKGEVMAIIETPELDAELIAGKAKLTAAEAQVKVREAEANFANISFERWRDSPKGVVSDQERDAKKAEYDSAVARLNAARAQVALDQADVDKLTTLAQFKQVQAPFDGTVVERRIDIGNLVTAGSTTNTTPLYRVTQDDPLRIFVDVPQSAASAMKVGVPVRISAYNLGGRTVEGKIGRTAEAIDPRARTLRVEADIANPDRSLVPGAFVDVAFQIPSQGGVEIPAAALLFRSSGPQVAVVGQDGRVQFHPVTIARDEGNKVEIGSGLSVGDRVALNLSSRIANGDKVTISEAESDLSSASAQTK